MFLSHDDIVNLTGYKRSSCQIKWLLRNGIKYLTACDGKPRVLVSQIESVIGAEAKPTRRRTEPNFDRFERAVNGA